MSLIIRIRRNQKVYNERMTEDLVTNECNLWAIVELKLKPSD
jgi:hypothetical protein